MDRPPSIVRFEQLYIASFVVGLVATALGWPAQQAMLANNPQLAQMTWFLPATTIGRIVIAIALWWFVARRGSVVAKWIVVVFAAFTVLSLVFALYGLAMGRGGAFVLASSIVSGALYVWAAALLFRPDAALWFGETGEPAEPIA